ncbi:DUF2807 domain-containing protein [Flavobacterium sp. CYK-4]|uniref:GIN domain-containing protein n=1 Tax=Flavobacterium lotistagni TaxID=2709660 RepID=UPI00140B3054|nr:DUF2807 domain-containing protein [Flavobacterium lotistagni]NHM06320.1 DUF2807 domain-containing protein [Flavobacterium lotistagni]
MKHLIALVTLLLFTSMSFAQKEKVKGSKIVTVVQKDITPFEELEISDNFDIFLIKGDKCALEIEADDNLQEYVSINAKGKALQIAASRQVSSFKKFSIRVTYTDGFKMLTAKDDANITALAELNLPNFTFKIHDNTRLYANVNAKTFTLMTDDKSKTELNLKSEDATIEMSKSSQLKALISATQLKFDMYQKSKATIEGDAINMKLRLDNDADFTGSKLTTKNTDLLAEGASDCSINVATKLVLDAKGKSEINLYGNQKIEVKNFLDSASLNKKPLK